MQIAVSRIRPTCYFSFNRLSPQVIEYARNVCNIPNATSDELDAETTDPVVKFMPEGDRTVSF